MILLRLAISLTSRSWCPYRTRPVLPSTTHQLEAETAGFEEFGISLRVSEDERSDRGTDVFRDLIELERQYIG